LRNARCAIATARRAVASSRLARQADFRMRNKYNNIYSKNSGIVKEKNDNRKMQLAFVPLLGTAARQAGTVVSR